MTNPSGGLGKNARRFGAWLALLLLFQAALSALALARSGERGHGTCITKQIYGEGERPAPAAPGHRTEKCCVAHFSDNVFSPASASSGLIECRIALGEGVLPPRCVWPVPRLQNLSAFPRAPPILFL